MDFADARAAKPRALVASLHFRATTAGADEEKNEGEDS
jgi:hypothetical protein